MSSTAPLLLKPLTRYKRRDGGFADVVVVGPFSAGRFVDAKDYVFYWHNDGRFVSELSPHQFDLVEEIAPIEAAEADKSNPPAAVALVGLLERERDDLKRDLANVTEERNKLNDELVRVIAAIPTEFTFAPPDGGDVKPWDAVQDLAKTLRQARAERDAAVKKIRALIEFCEVVAYYCGETIQALKTRIEAVKREVAR